MSTDKDIVGGLDTYRTHTYIIHTHIVHRHKRAQAFLQSQTCDTKRYTYIGKFDEQYEPVCVCSEQKRLNTYFGRISFLSAFGE